MGVVGEIFDEVRIVHIALVPDAHKVRETEKFLPGVFDHRCPEGPALGDEGNGSCRRHHAGKGGIETIRHGDHPETVRADEPHAEAGGDPQDLFLAFSPFRPALREPSGDDAGRADALFPCVREDAGDFPGRDADDGQINLVRYVREARICPESENLPALWIDWKYSPLEPVFPLPPRDLPEED